MNKSTFNSTHRLTGNITAKLLTAFKLEFFEAIPPTSFFFIDLSLIISTKRLFLREYGIPLNGLGMPLIGGLQVGKVVLIADKQTFVNKFPDKSTLYNFARKAMIYFIATLLVHYLEYPISLLIRLKNFMETNYHFMDKIVTCPKIGGLP